jgi:hypothetical protein
MLEWLAIGVGLAGGVAACFYVAGRTLPPLVERSRNPLLVTRLAFAGTVIALLPALLLSIAVGAPLGAAGGAPGIAAGVAVAFALLLLTGTFAGVLLGRILTRRGHHS